MSRPVITLRRLGAHDSNWERVADVHNGERNYSDHRSAVVTAMNYHGAELRIDVSGFSGGATSSDAAGSFTVVVAPQADIYVNGTRIWPPRPHVWEADPERSHLCIACGRPAWYGEGERADDWHTSYPAGRAQS